MIKNKVIKLIEGKYFYFVVPTYDKYLPIINFILSRYLINITTEVTYVLKFDICMYIVRLDTMEFLSI